jgi:hypothetical protein
LAISSLEVTKCVIRASLGVDFVELGHPDGRVIKASVNHFFPDGVCYMKQLQPGTEVIAGIVKVEENRQPSRRVTGRITKADGSLFAPSSGDVKMALGQRAAGRVVAVRWSANSVAIVDDASGAIVTAEAEHVVWSIGRWQFRSDAVACGTRVSYTLKESPEVPGLLRAMEVRDEMNQPLGLKEVSEYEKLPRKTGVVVRTLKFEGMAVIRETSGAGIEYPTKLSNFTLRDDVKAPRNSVQPGLKVTFTLAFDGKFLAPVNVQSAAQEPIGGNDNSIRAVENTLE